MWVDPHFDVCAATRGLRNLHEGQHIEAIPISYIFPGSKLVSTEQSVLDIDHFDVIQGNVGDCWLLSAFQTVAFSCPEFIDRTIVYSDEIFGFSVFKLLGKMIFVDHFVPVVVSAEGSEVIGPQISKQHEYWPILLEKAFIKLFYSCSCPRDIFEFNMKRRALRQIPPGPSYVDIDGGFPRWAISILLGARIDPLKTRFIPDLFDLFECCKNEKLIACCCTSCEKSDSHVEDGFVFGHAYSLLLIDRSRGLLRVSNPWGTVENTKYDDKVDDGQFWVDQHDFREKFPVVVVAKVTRPKRDVVPPTVQAM